MRLHHGKAKGQQEKKALSVGLFEEREKREQERKQERDKIRKGEYLSSFQILLFRHQRLNAILFFKIFPTTETDDALCCFSLSRFGVKTRQIVLQHTATLRSMTFFLVSEPQESRTRKSFRKKKGLFLRL